MNEEVYKIRHEIQSLHKRLAEIEKETLSEEEQAQMCSCNVCGHDVVLGHIQKLCKERETKSISIMAGWERVNENKWYSTTVSPECLPYLLRDIETIKKYLEPILDINTLKILQYMSVECESTSTEEIAKKLDIPLSEVINQMKKLMKQELITTKEENNLAITIRGWHTYITLAHLSYNYTLKLETDKAIHIAPVFKEVFGKEWGEYLGISHDKVIDELINTGWLKKLNDLGVKECDIEKAVYEANYKDK